MIPKKSDAKKEKKIIKKEYKKGCVVCRLWGECVSFKIYGKYEC